MITNQTKPMDNRLENPLAPSHIFDIRAFTPLYLNHKLSTLNNYLLVRPPLVENK